MSSVGVVYFGVVYFVIAIGVVDTIEEFDIIARLGNPLTHLHEDEAPVQTDKLESIH